MEDMYVHQHTKVEPNWSTDGTVISADVHTHSPPTQTLFYHKSMHFLLVYLSIYIALDLYIRVNENSLAYRHHILPLYTLYNI